MVDKIATTAERPHPGYGNPIDQRRYIYSLQKSQQNTVLDIASGVGWGSYLMASAGANVVGVDISESAIKFSRQFFSHPRLEYKIGDSAFFNSQDLKFDLITCFETLEHVDRPVEFLKSLHSVSHHGTTLLLSTPNAVLHGSTHTKPCNPFHLKEYTKQELVDLVASCGFTLECYMGQSPILATQENISRYIKFVKDYWRNKEMQARLGLPYRIYRRLILRNDAELSDPALMNPAVQLINPGFEPVYHFAIFKVAS